MICSIIGHWWKYNGPTQKKCVTCRWWGTLPASQWDEYSKIKERQELLQLIAERPWI